MDDLSKQNLISSQMESQKLALRENEKSKDKLDELLGACLALQKLYGRDVANSETIIRLFHKLLAEYPGDKVLLAFETWMERSQEFPTPADIIGMIRRNGRPPIKESDVITIRRKEVCDWSHSEAQLVEDWEDEQNESWGNNYRDTEQEERLRDENQRLRQQVHELKSENVRAWDEVKKLRQHKGIEKPSLSQQEKIDRTVAMMKQTGATDDDVDEFLRGAA